MANGNGKRYVAVGVTDCSIFLHDRRASQLPFRTHSLLKLHCITMKSLSASRQRSVKNLADLECIALCRIVKDLAEVREIITNTVTDDTKRRKLLRLAGAAPDVWLGCSVGDVVFMLEDELADQERGVQVVETGKQLTPWSSALMGSYSS